MRWCVRIAAPPPPCLPCTALTLTLSPPPRPLLLSRAVCTTLYDPLRRAWEQLPPKEALFIGKLQNHWQLVVHDNAPLFFSCRGGPYLPVLRLLHAYPTMMPTVQVDKGAIPFVLRGANIMCRGLTTPGARMDTPLDEGTMVAIMAEGKEHALAVGRLIMSTDQIREKNKGMGVEMIHFIGDGLWYAERVDRD